MKNKKFLQKFWKDYNNIIQDLYRKNMIRDLKMYSTEDNNNKITITREGRKNESNILYDKHLSIENVMEILLEKREYNILLYDRSIIQFEFIIEDGKIIKERLIYIKKHNYLWSKEEIADKDIDNFELDWFVEEIGIPVVIRIDYDKDNHVDIFHPITHMTLSNYDECRIPMKGVVSLYNFINFVLNFFYNESLEFNSVFIDNDITITENEKKRLHFEWD